MIKDFSRPRPMTAEERATFLQTFPGVISTYSVPTSPQNLLHLSVATSGFMSKLQECYDIVTYSVRDSP
jgi:hypothetical protein